MNEKLKRSNKPSLEKSKLKENLSQNQMFKMKII